MRKRKTNGVVPIADVIQEGAQEGLVKSLVNRGNIHSIHYIVIAIHFSLKIK